MALSGRLRVEHKAWLLAWRSRRANPLAQFAALQANRQAQRRYPWLPCSPFLFTVSVCVSLATAALIIAGGMRYLGVSASPIATPAFGLTALAWAGIQLVDGAAVVCLAWLAERLLQSYLFASSLLARYPSRNEPLGTMLATSLLSDCDYLVGAFSHITRLCWPPLAGALALSALTDYVYTTGLLELPWSWPPLEWTPAELPWLALLGAGAVLLKAAAGLLAIWAGALLLLALSPHWRSSALAHGAAWLAVCWHLPAMLLATPLAMHVRNPVFKQLPWLQELHQVANNHLVVTPVLIVALLAWAWLALAKASNKATADKPTRAAGVTGVLVTAGVLWLMLGIAAGVAFRDTTNSSILDLQVLTAFVAMCCDYSAVPLAAIYSYVADNFYDLPATCSITIGSFLTQVLLALLTCIILATHARRAVDKLRGLTA